MHGKLQMAIKKKKNKTCFFIPFSEQWFFFPNDCTDAQKSLMFDLAVLREWSAHWNVSADWNCSPITIKLFYGHHFKTEH